MPKTSWTNKYGVVKDGILKEIRIYRDTWARGDTSCLTTSFNKHCCIGFMALACKVPNRVLINVGTIDQLNAAHRGRVVFREGDNFDDAVAEMYAVNDSDCIYDAGKERIITRFFKDTYDVKVVFLDKEPK